MIDFAFRVVELCHNIYVNRINFHNRVTSINQVGFARFDATLTSFLADSLFFL